MTFSLNKDNLIILLYVYIYIYINKSVIQNRYVNKDVIFNFCMQNKIIKKYFIGKVIAFSRWVSFILVVFLCIMSDTCDF